MSNSKAPITISTHNGSRVCIGHNLRNERSVGNPDIDPTRKHLNETLIFEPIRIAYERIFGQAVKDYNEKQTCEERQIKDYYGKIKEDVKKHPVYEMIIQVGDYQNIGNDNPTAREILRDFISDWKRRNPNLELIGAYIHADEATLHAHLDYIPVATGYIRGMHTQNGLDKALRQQGFDGKTAALTPQILWEKRENAQLEQLCIARGFEVIHPERDKIDETKRVHQTVEEYKTEYLAEEISKNFAYNQLLQQQHQKLEQENSKLEKEIDKKKKDIEEKNKELKHVQGRILSEKGVETFRDNPDKNWLGRVKQTQTLTLDEYKSLMKTVSKVQDGDKRERQLSEREKKINTDLNTAKKNLDYREKNLANREENKRKAETNIENKRKAVERGLYDNTNKKLNDVEEEFNDLKKFCDGVKYKDGHSVLNDFNRHQEQELQRQQEERKNCSKGFGR